MTTDQNLDLLRAQLQEICERHIRSGVAVLRAHEVSETEIMRIEHEMARESAAKVAEALAWARAKLEEGP